MQTNFLVQQELIVDFAEILTDNNLQNTIIGTEQDAILIEVEHSRQDRDALDELAVLTEIDE